MINHEPLLPTIFNSARGIAMILPLATHFLVHESGI
jgi:hypothetical protein